MKKEESFAEANVDDGDKDSIPTKPKGPPQEDFPWPHFASLAMHNLITHWELQPVAKVMQEETKVAPKVNIIYIINNIIYFNKKLILANGFLNTIFGNLNINIGKHL